MAASRPTAAATPALARSPALRPAAVGASRALGQAQASVAGGGREPAGRLSPALDQVLRRALGPLALPEPMQLAAALRAASGHVALADRAAPGLAALVRLVLSEEALKLDRYLDMKGE